MNGVFAVKKPTGPTSQDVVGKLKHIFTKSQTYAANSGTLAPKPNRRNRKQRFIKIGHGGTLDPLADGVLVIGVGSGTKQLASYLGQCAKVYTARAMLGASTTTYDSHGSVLAYGKVDPGSIGFEQLNQVLPQFRGAIKQLPPVFSALKMDGKPLYEYARTGVPLPRAIEQRDCVVSQLNAEIVPENAADLPKNVASQQERAFAAEVTKVPEDPLAQVPEWRGAYVDLTFSVSSGTYIRTLIHDIGEALGTKAHMVKLTRDQQGEWELGKNVLPLDLFDSAESVWWPVLQLTLAGGPKQLVDLDSVPNETTSENKTDLEEPTSENKTDLEEPASENKTDSEEPTKNKTEVAETNTETRTSS